MVCIFAEEKPRFCVNGRYTKVIPGPHITLTSCQALALYFAKWVNVEAESLRGSKAGSELILYWYCRCIHAVIISYHQETRLLVSHITLNKSTFFLVFNPISQWLYYCCELLVNYHLEWFEISVCWHCRSFQHTNLQERQKYT